jgi:hypothetical protein
VTLNIPHESLLQVGMVYNVWFTQNLAQRRVLAGS